MAPSVLVLISTALVRLLTPPLTTSSLRSELSFSQTGPHAAQ